MNKGPYSRARLYRRNKEWLQMRQTGMKLKDIALASGITMATISRATSNRWFQEADKKWL